MIKWHDTHFYMLLFDKFIQLFDFIAFAANMLVIITIIIIIIKNECHSNIIVDRLQGCYMI